MEVRNNDFAIGRTEDINHARSIGHANAHQTIEKVGLAVTACLLTLGCAAAVYLDAPSEIGKKIASLGCTEVVAHVGTWLVTGTLIGTMTAGCAAWTRITINATQAEIMTKVGAAAAFGIGAAAGIGAGAAAGLGAAVITGAAAGLTAVAGGVVGHKLSVKILQLSAYASRALGELECVRNCMGALNASL